MGGWADTRMEMMGVLSWFCFCLLCADGYGYGYEYGFVFMFMYVVHGYSHMSSC